MVDIQSKEVIDKISDELKVQPALSIPRNISKDIQLSYNVNPTYINKTAAVNLSDSASATIRTTDSEKDTFLTSVYLTVTKDAISDSLFSQITAVLETGETSTILLIRYEPTTTGSFHQQLVLTRPIKLKKNSQILFLHNTATASIDGTAVINYYETDPQ